MAEFSNPAEIARETLKQMALNRLLPTPENYRKTYCQIAGESLEEVHPVVQLLTERLASLPKPNFEIQRNKQLLADFAETGNWSAWLEKVLDALADATDSESRVVGWADLVRELVRQWDLRQAGWTTPKKREAFERVLINFGAKPDVLFEKLDALVRAWADNQQVDELLASSEYGTGELEESTETAESGGEVFSAWRDLLIYTLDYGVAARLTTVPDLHEEAIALVTRLRETTDMKGLEAFAAIAKKFWLKLELRNESDQTLMIGLQRLLRLLVNNIAELVEDDGWMQGQVEVIRAVIDRPLDSRFLYEMEESLSELIFKQGHLKQSLVEAKHTFKSMVTSFIERLGSMASNTGSYHDKMVDYSNEIKQTDDLTKLANIVDRLMDDTRSMQLDMLRSRDELIHAREEAEKASERVSALEKEIEKVSEQVRTDQLTGVLNRRGMEDAFASELSRANREHNKLSVALLDIDNFKKLNDRLGHQAGDMALAHLAKVVKDVLRPTDSVARYGGEEFVILLPATPIPEAVLVMQRVQRELTKRFYLHNNERVLITFSCGVAEYREGENEGDVISRADTAMYQAKLSGKNRVEVSQ